MIEARFRIGKGDFLLDADLSIPETGVTALFGPSGSGKTSLLRAFAGLERHEGGFLKIGDSVWQADDVFVPPHRRPIGYVFQEASLFPHLSVLGNLRYGAERVAQSDRTVSLDKAVALLGIRNLLDRRPDQLSGGERQRVAIARALAVSPKLLLMDEPLASLDLSRRYEILPYIESLRRELDIPVIYVSHHPDEVAQLADHLVLLDDGRVLASGRVGEILTRLDLPPAHAVDAASVIDAVVSGHDDTFDLTHVDFLGGRFTVARHDLEVGRPVRVRVAARDVSLTLERQTETSILNIFPAVVEDLKPEGKSQITIRLSVAEAPLLARVTRKSAESLGLHPGAGVYAQVKSVALLS